MSRWSQFLERKEAMEDKEERLHKDLDGDDEKGESKEHKKKVFGKEDKKCKKCGMMMKKCNCH